MKCFINNEKRSYENWRTQYVKNNHIGRWPIPKDLEKSKEV